MSRQYYYDTGSEKIGPVSGEDLVELRAEGTINDETWVRRADKGTWRPLKSVNLSEEEEEAANPSLLAVLRRSGLLWPLLLLLLGVILVVVLAAGLAVQLWPLLLALFVFWLLSKALR